MKTYTAEQMIPAVWAAMEAYGYRELPVIGASVFEGFRKALAASDAHLLSHIEISLAKQLECLMVKQEPQIPESIKHLMAASQGVAMGSGKQHDDAVLEAYRIAKAEGGAK